MATSHGVAGKSCEGPQAPSRRARNGFLGAYVLCAFFAYPQLVGGSVLDLGIVLGWVYPGLLVLGLRGLRARLAVLVGTGIGLAAHYAIMHWIFVVTVYYGHAPWFAGIFAPLAPAGFVALFVGVFAFGLSKLEKHRLDSPLLIAVLWTAVDYVRGVALGGFPWATLGYTQHQNEWLMGLAPFTGVYGLSFAAVLGSALLARGVAGALQDGKFRGRFFSARRGSAGFENLCAASLLALIHVLGFASATRIDEDALPSVRVAVVQGNIEQGVKWSPDWVERTMAIYTDLTRKAALEGAELIVWPESAVPGGIDSHSGNGSRLAALARETGARLVVGGVGFTFDGQGRIIEYFDSAFAIDERGRHIDRYDKGHLVPFGEYVPLRSLLGRVLGTVASGITQGDLTAGSGPRPIRFEPGPGRSPLRVGVPICYELLFPDLVRRFVKDGAELLLGITNDAWYGRTGAPYQFLVMTAMRSAETRVWTARAANTGVSAFIDARGKVRERTRIFERDFLVADVPLRAAPTGGSFYTRHGDWFAYACWAGLTIAGIAARYRAPPRIPAGEGAGN